MTSPERMQFPRVPAKIKAATGQEYPYRRLYARLLDGRLPMIQQDTDTNRYYIEAADFPALLAALGLTALAPMPVPKVSNRARTATPAASASRTAT